MESPKESHWHPLHRPSQTDINNAFKSGLIEPVTPPIASTVTDQESAVSISEPPLEASTIESELIEHPSASSSQIPRQHDTLIIPSFPDQAPNNPSVQSAISPISDPSALTVESHLTPKAHYVTEPVKSVEPSSPSISIKSDKTEEIFASLLNPSSQDFDVLLHNASPLDKPHMDSLTPEPSLSPKILAYPEGTIGQEPAHIETNPESHDSDDDLSWLQGNNNTTESDPADNFFTDMSKHGSSENPKVDNSEDLSNAIPTPSRPPQDTPATDQAFVETDDSANSFFANLESSDSKVSIAPAPKEDLFKDIFSDDDDAFSVIDSGDKVEDDFFQSLGTSKLNITAAQNAIALFDSIDESSAPKKTLPDDIFSKILANDIEDEHKSRITDNNDLSKSLAFLDDDELLPENYIEAPSSRSSSAAPPMRTQSAAPATAFSNGFSTPVMAAATIARSQSGQAQPYSSYSPQQYQPPHSKYPAKPVPNNAFDLPNDMVGKTVRRMNSFHHPTQASPLQPQSPSTFKPSINPNKSFFEELPPIPKRSMSRRSSNASNASLQNHVYPTGINQPSHTPNQMGYYPNSSQTLLTSPSFAPLAPPRLPFAPIQRGHSRNSSGGGSVSSYAPSSPASASVYKPQYHNPYEPYNPLMNMANLSASSPQNHHGPSSYHPPSTLNPYEPLAQPQRPIQSQYAPQSHVTGPVSAYGAPNQYAQPSQKLPPPKGLQPAARLVSKSGFGELPADIGRKQAEFARSPEVQHAMMRHYRTPSGHDLGQLRQKLTSPLSTASSMMSSSPPQLRQSFSSNRGYAASTVSETSQRQASVHQAPINNEALLRRQFPIFRWGMGGKAVSVIPASISFGGGSTSPEVKVIYTSQVLRSDSLTAKFPFPLVTVKGVQKNKKKELEKWIESHVQELDTKYTRPDDAPKMSSRILLWKVMLALLQADTPVTRPSKALKEAIRKILDPFALEPTRDELVTFAPAVDIYRKNMHRRTSSAGVGASRGLKSDDINKVMDFLKVGEKESALKYALDQRLWAHALLIASSIGPSEWMDAVFEFVREEIRVFPSQSARDMALIYRVFSGAGADSGKFLFSLFSFLALFVLTL